MRNRTGLLVGISCGIVACILSWLLMTDTSSPLQNYLLYHPAARNLWGAFIFPVLVFMMSLGMPQSDLVFYGLVFLQWFVFGFVAGIVIGRIRRT